MKLYDARQGPLKDGKVWNRSTLIQHCIDRYSYKTYLEIGYGLGPSAGFTWNQIELKDKTCVDPNGSTPSFCVKKTSDQFFKDNTRSFDVIFIDGCHRAETVYRDIINSLDCLNEGGIIFTHDNSPMNKRQTDPKACGDGWKTIPYIRKRTDIDVCTLNADLGVGIIRKRKNQNVFVTQQGDELYEFMSCDTPRFNTIGYGSLHNRRVELLNLLEIDDVLEWL